MLVTTIERMKELVPVIVGSDFKKYETFVKEGREWVKREITGSTLYAKLDVAGNETLKEYAEGVVANKGYLLGIPFFDLVETEAGFAVVRTETKAPASKERVEKLTRGVESWLSESIERLLEYLEENSQYHEDWKGSSTFSLLTETYIHKLKDFRRIAPFEGTRLDYVAQLPKMLDVINLTIAPVISSDLSDEIIEQLRDNDMTPANQAILKNLQFAFANYVVGQPDKAHSYLMKVRKVLLASPDTYPTFRDSDLYASILATVIEKNTDEKPIFRAGF
ncbi:DUF6712 family protein [Draconibacterium orientale]|uniref:DUF6712 family protein n=1 Tax=Draconibacterium orientale TaxID=1168034 RepID=UPI0029C0CA28|nr:DUF6712 family protein [Draconibacterium orientale]